MMCYRDRCYCSSEKCITPQCLRRLTDDECARASVLRMPIAWMDYEKHCERFSAPTPATNEAEPSSPSSHGSTGPL